MLACVFHQCVPLCEALLVASMGVCRKRYARLAEADATTPAMRPGSSGVTCVQPVRLLGCERVPYTSTHIVVHVNFGPSHDPCGNASHPLVYAPGVFCHSVRVPSPHPTPSPTPHPTSRAAVDHGRCFTQLTAEGRLYVGVVSAHCLGHTHVFGFSVEGPGARGWAAINGHMCLHARVTTNARITHHPCRATFELASD